MKLFGDGKKGLNFFFHLSKPTADLYDVLQDNFTVLFHQKK